MIIRQIRVAFSAFLMLGWAAILVHADSYISPYLLCAAAGTIALWENKQAGDARPEKGRGWILFFAAAFALATVLANYRLLIPMDEKKAFSCGILLCGGCLIGWHIPVWLLRKSRKLPGAERPVTDGKPVRKVFWITFGCILAVDLAVLFLCFYPGILTPDSFNQIAQNRTGIYSNHHPFWHTMIIGGCMDLGMALFRDINGAVAVYSVFQAACMAAIFAYLMTTLYQAGVKRGWVIAAAAAYILLPYHVMYSFSMWKDVLFGGTVALFLCALFRKLRGIGNQTLNLVWLILGMAGFCLLRSNGWAAACVSLVILWIALGKGQRRMLLILAGVLAVTFGMKHLLLGWMGVEQPDAVEFFSVPEQQIARVIAEGAEIPEEEEEEIRKIMDPEEIRRAYRPEISDPVKEIIRKTDPEYFKNHLGEYAGLWLRIGARHPGLYLTGWIDQTRGYWNSGYENLVMVTVITNDEYGIRQSKPDFFLSRWIRNWVGLFASHEVFDIFRSIGIHSWGILLCLLICWIRREKEGVLFVPLAAILASLMATTPISGEFRYAYAVFASLPFLIPAVFLSSDETGKTADNGSICDADRADEKETENWSLVE